MSSTPKFDNDESGIYVNDTLYRSMIGTLLYLNVSRADILFSICMCARFQSNPKVSHLNVVKKIFKYLVGTSNLGLWFSKESDFKLIGFLMLILLDVELMEKVLVELVNS